MCLLVSFPVRRLPVCWWTAGGSISPYSTRYPLGSLFPWVRISGDRRWFRFVGRRSGPAAGQVTSGGAGTGLGCREVRRDVLFRDCVEGVVANRQPPARSGRHPGVGGNAAGAPRDAGPGPLQGLFGRVCRSRAFRSHTGDGTAAAGVAVPYHLPFTSSSVAFHRSSPASDSGGERSRRPFDRPLRTSVGSRPSEPSKRRVWGPRRGPVGPGHERGAVGGGHGGRKRTPKLAAMIVSNSASNQAGSA
jgi:hypothetical protein